jgi:hypothetical protein
MKDGQLQDPSSPGEEFPKAGCDRGWDEPRLESFKKRRAWTGAPHGESLAGVSTPPDETRAKPGVPHRSLPGDSGLSSLAGIA